MDWRNRAACLDEDPELFFPIGNTGPGPPRRSKRPRPSADAARSSTPASSGPSRPVRTPVSGAASPRTSAALSSAATLVLAGQAEPPARLEPRAPDHPVGALLRARPPASSAIGPRAARGTRPADDGAARPAPRLPGDPAAQVAAPATCTIWVPSPLRLPGRSPPAARRRRRRPHTASSGSSASTRRSAAISHRPAPGRQAVLDRVVHQLGQHQRQRRSRPRPAAARTCPVGRCAPAPRRAATSTSAVSSRGDDVVEVDRLVEALATASRAPCAIVPTRRTASSSAARASSSGSRRACSRSSAATVCRLFLTRWWISRIVASLVISSRSRRRSSLTSRSSTMAPMRRPSSIERDRPQRHASCRAASSVGAPRRAAGHDQRQALVDRVGLACSSVGDDLGQRRADHLADVPEPVDGRDGVRAGVGRPIPSTSSRITPSPTRGAPRRARSARRRPGSRRRRSSGPGRRRAAT